jgi:hypothetical protein
MTIAGTVIVLEACGNTQYLLPLMLTFAAARYTGNAINEPMYDMQIRLKEMPFLADSLKTLGWTHSLTYSLTHLLTHSLTHSLTHLLTYSLTHSRLLELRPGVRNHVYPSQMYQ